MLRLLKGIMSSSVLQGVATVPVLLGKSSPRSPLPEGFALALGKSGGPPASLCFLSKLGWKCVSFRVSPQGTEQHPQRGDTEKVTHHCQVSPETRSHHCPLPGEGGCPSRSEWDPLRLPAPHSDGCSADGPSGASLQPQAGGRIPGALNTCPHISGPLSLES